MYSHEDQFMIVAIHQPHFLPWQGYLDRMRQADLFILLDHVQFERQNYQNRVMIKTGEGPRWITVPVHHSQQEAIMDKTIDNHNEGRLRWGRKVYQTIQYAYQGAPFFNLYAPQLKTLFDTRWEKLMDLDMAILDLLRNALDIRTPMVRSSDLHVTGQKNEMILALCKAVGADTFLGGLGGCRRYLDTEAFERAGINVAWQKFTHPHYPQRPRAENFVEGLASIDLLFNCGPESAEILQGRELAYAANH